MTNPQIIQGGMGTGVSGWALARAVSLRGQLGVVSGTAIEAIFARRLQLGDPGGMLRHACRHFPWPEIAGRVLSRYFVEGGIPAGKPFKAVPAFSAEPARALVELTVLANFAEVFLAKEGHLGLVGINLLEKIQLPTLPSLFGAMLADVDYVLMGAGIPRAIPGLLDQLATGASARLKLDVEGAPADHEFYADFDPADFCGGTPPILRRPLFLAVISSATLAIAMAKKSTGRVDGFVVEGASAGGHNAPPRGPMQLDPRGQPIYGARDDADLEKIKSLGLPFWLAGSYGRPGKLAEAIALGAAGIQVGTPFAFCEESGVDPVWKRRVVAASRRGEIDVFTDPIASPTGFPFKVVRMKGAEEELAPSADRERVCDMGYLRHPFQDASGRLGFRCPGEDAGDYLRKGGAIADTIGRQCVCNGLLATIGLGQIRPDGRRERPLLTAGDDIRRVADFLPEGKETFTADDVIDRLLHPAA